MSLAKGKIDNNSWFALEETNFIKRVIMAFIVKSLSTK